MKKSYSLSLDSKLMFAIEHLAEEQHRSISNMVEVMLYGYADFRSNTTSSLELLIHELRYAGVDFKGADVFGLIDSVINQSTCGEALLAKAKEER